MRSIKNYNDINESDIFCRFQNFKFYFSSDLRKEKFASNFEEYSKNEAFKLIFRYNLKADIDSFKLMFIFSYYFKCERRGFKVERYSDDEFNVLLMTYYEIPTFMITGVGE